MYRIVKTFGPFAASHHLDGVPAGHQCGRPHGHNYVVEVEIEAEDVDETGFVVDYGELKPLNEYLTARMDHRDLNEEFDFNPTAENIARHVFEWINGTQAWPVVAVRVSETPGKTMSEYRRGSVHSKVVINNHVTTVLGARAEDSRRLLRSILKSTRFEL